MAEEGGLTINRSKQRRIRSARMLSDASDRACDSPACALTSRVCVSSSDSSSSSIGSSGKTIPSIAMDARSVIVVGRGDGAGDSTGVACVLEKRNEKRRGRSAR